MDIKIISQREIRGLTPLTELETGRLFSEIEKRLPHNNEVISISREGQDGIVFKTIAGPVPCYLRKREDGKILVIKRQDKSQKK